MKYTAYNNTKVDQQIDDHMKLIARELKIILGKDLYSIILTGGFGRGEGSILINPDNTVRIINDYDFEIVYRPKFGELLSKIIIKTKYTKALSILEERLAREIGVKQLDFTLRSLSDYPSVKKPKLSDYDTKYGHIVLCSENDPTTLMPNFNNEDIPSFEGSWLLRNRGIGLLLAYFYLDRNKTPDCQATDNFYIEINKALLAMGDALFIINKCYHHSYQRRLDTVDELASTSFERITELITLYKIAAEHKLRPKNDTFNAFETRELWHLVANLYIDLFIYYESIRQKTKFVGVEHYVNNIPGKVSLNSKEKLRILYEFLLGNIKKSDIPLMGIIRDKAINLGFTISLLACLHDDKKHRKLFKNMPGNLGITSQEVSKKYLLLSHPSGELARFLNSKDTQGK
ncbi:hypothetical protein MNBD_GAMMA05-626 [hydrothermal vent metagenome]|uniref:Uncharacterized protein n=1 Tax=hydrothermal vent metagenome TaxID=652676 RepID=A0A3B0X822_9ZZZZ